MLKGPRIGPVECLLWSAVVLAIFLLVLTRVGVGFGSDSYQYLSEAKNIASGEGLQTSVVHFDVERLHGRVPAPLTTFPPGYSLSIAALALLGISYENAGAVCSIAAGVGVISLLLMASTKLQLSPAAKAVAVCVVAFNAVSARLSTSIMTESLFTFFATAALAAIILAEPTDSRDGTIDRTMMLASGACAGIAYSIRYAGLFLVATLVVYHLARSIRANRSEIALRAASVAAALAVMMPVVVRNIAYTGSWRGGNTKAVTNPVGPALRDFLTSAFHTVIGWKKLHFGTGELLLLAGLSGCILAMLPLIATRRSFNAVLWFAPDTGVLLLYAAIYTAGMLYLSLHSVIDISVRTFQPLAPVFGLLAGVAYHNVAKDALHHGASYSRVFTAAAAAALGGYVIANLGNVSLLPPPPPHRVVETLLLRPVTPGISAHEWIHTNIPDNAPIAASCGQITGYLLNRKTLSLVGKQFSDERWDSERTRSEMERFGAQWLILYPNAACAYEQRDWPYLGALAEGKPAEGMHLAARSEDVLIWRRDDKRAN